jgi:hypothetical protein
MGTKRTVIHRKRHGAGEAREAHNLDVPGSKPGAATSLFAFLCKHLDRKQVSVLLFLHFLHMDRAEGNSTRTSWSDWQAQMIRTLQVKQEHYRQANESRNEMSTEAPCSITPSRLDSSASRGLDGKLVPESGILLLGTTSD